MTNFEALAIIGQALVVTALFIGYLKQRTLIARQQHQITQNMIALNKAVKALKGKSNAD